MPGLRPLKYSTSVHHEIEWKRLTYITSRPFWSGYYKGVHVVDLFKAPGGVFSAIVYDRVTMRGGLLTDMLLHVAGLFVNKGN